MRVLQDFDVHGNEIDRAKLKAQNELIANALRKRPFYSPKYNRHCMNVAKELDHCSEWAKYKVDPKTGQMRLCDTRYCKQNLCRLCDRVRYNHQSARLWHITQALGSNAKYLFITFTFKNVEYKSIRKGVDTLNYAISKLMNYTAIKHYIHGSAKSIETTLGQDGKCNLHIHMLVNVMPTFYNGTARLNHGQWSKLWCKALKVGYVANIKVQRPKDMEDVSALGNYMVKMDNKPNVIDWDNAKDVARLVAISEEIYRKHRLTLTGIFKDMDKIVNVRYKRNYKQNHKIDTGKHETYKNTSDTFDYDNAKVVTYTYYKHDNKQGYKLKE